MYILLSSNLLLSQKIEKIVNKGPATVVLLFWEWNARQQQAPCVERLHSQNHLLTAAGVLDTVLDN